MNGIFRNGDPKPTPTTVRVSFMANFRGRSVPTACSWSPNPAATFAQTIPAMFGMAAGVTLVDLQEKGISQITGI